MIAKPERNSDDNAFALPRRLLVAIGGNAIHPGHIEGTAAEQLAVAAQTGRALLPIMEMDNELIITHGNGPVVGKILMRHRITSYNVCYTKLLRAGRRGH